MLCVHTFPCKTTQVSHRVFNQHHHFHKHQSPRRVFYTEAPIWRWEVVSLCVCTCPMTAELKQGVRMQKTLRNTSRQVREEPEGKKRHSLKCTGYFILINSSARHPTRAAVWADTNHCIISRTWCIWE